MEEKLINCPLKTTVNIGNCCIIIKKMFFSMTKNIKLLTLLGVLY